MYVSKITVICIKFIFGFTLSVYPDTVKLKAGIYQNPPKVYMDNSQAPAGFIVEIMDEIARKKKWEVDYIFDSWDTNIQRLKSGELDLLLDVTLTPEREKFFRFNRIPVIESWLQVFSLEPCRFKSIKDLNGTKLAVLKGSVQHSYFADRAADLYGIEYTLITCEDYPATEKALFDGRADAVIADRFFHFAALRDKKILPAPVILRPANIHFAFRQDYDITAIELLDKKLASMKNDPDSAYYESLQNLLTIKTPAHLPGHIVQIMAVIALALLFFAVAAGLQRFHIRKKTAALHRRNIQLEKLSKELEKTLEEKNNLVSELFHRTRNNMQVISSLLGLHADRTDKPEIKNSFKDAINRIHSIAIVHDMLYKNSSLTRIDLSGYIKELADTLINNFHINDHGVNLELDMQPTTLAFDHAPPLGLVMNELLSNSLKSHLAGREDKSRIYISLRQTDDSTVKIIYKDNIKGAQSRINSDIVMTLIKNIMEKQLKGSVNFITGNGTHCEIEFKTEIYAERIQASSSTPDDSE